MSNKKQFKYSDIILDKERNFKLMVTHKLIQLQAMLKLGNLPDDMPEEELKKSIFEDGYVILDNGYDGKWYGYKYTQLAPPEDAYYRDKYAIIVNPWQNYNKTREIGTECFIIRCNPYLLGLKPLIEKWCYALCETDVSMRMAKINGRLQALISAFDSKPYESAVKFLKDIEDGKLGVVRQNFSSQMTDTMSIQAQPLSNSSSSIIRELIELRTYEESCLCDVMSLKKNGNVKRENISENEASLDDDPVRITADIIIDTIQKDIDIFNKATGNNVTVEFNSSWLTNVLEEELKLESLDDEDAETGEEINEEDSDESKQDEDESKEDEKGDDKDEYDA